MTRVAIHQPNYFPWLGYFAKVLKADLFVFLDDVDYQSGNSSSVTNRTKIKTSNGPVRLSVPVARAASGLISDMGIDNSGNWAHKHASTLRFAYAKSPFAGSVLPLVERVLAKRSEGLAALNIEGVRSVCDYLSIRTPRLVSSGLGIESRDRNLRLVEICRRLGADTYLSGWGGRRYNDMEIFAANGIAIEYANYVSPEYPQLHGAFLPNLSVLDALFNCGTDAIGLLS